MPAPVGRLLRVVGREVLDAAGFAWRVGGRSAQCCAPRAERCGRPGVTRGGRWSAAPVRARYGNRMCLRRVLWV